MKKFLFFLFVTLFLCGCNHPMAEDVVNVGNTVITVPIDYGNHVFYFNCARAGFANSLSKFLAEHGDLRLLAMTGDGADNRDLGYFVVFESHENEK